MSSDYAVKYPILPGDEVRGRGLTLEGIGSMMRPIDWWLSVSVFASWFSAVAWP